MGKGTNKSVKDQSNKHTKMADRIDKIEWRFNALMSERLCNGLNEGSLTASMNRLTANKARNWAKKILITYRLNTQS